MKYLLFIMMLFVTMLLSAQRIPDGIKNAIKTDDSESFSKLISEENINRCYETGNSNYTLLAIAIKYDATNCFKALLSKKANLEKACTSKTPLMYAAKYGKLNIAKALIEVGAKPKTKNYKGRTALDYAKKYEQGDIITYLESL